MGEKEDRKKEVKPHKYKYLACFICLGKIFGEPSWKKKTKNYKLRWDQILNCPNAYLSINMLKMGDPEALKKSGDSHDYVRKC